MSGLEISLGTLLVAVLGFGFGTYIKKQDKSYCDKVQKTCEDKFKEGREKFAKMEEKHAEVITNLADTNTSLAVIATELKYLTGDREV